MNYDANVTWNENTHFTKRDNLANLLVNVIILCFIIIGFALVAGVAFGTSEYSPEGCSPAGFLNGLRAVSLSRCTCRKSLRNINC